MPTTGGRNADRAECRPGAMPNTSIALKSFDLISFNLLVFFLEDVTMNIDAKHNVDLAKAFDTVPHQRLLGKLKAHGVDGLVYHWIEAWLPEGLFGWCLFQLEESVEWSSTGICSGPHPLSYLHQRFGRSVIQ